jgi:hypothetical protein
MSLSCVSDWHKNGAIWYRAFCKDGKLSGTCREWFENGRLMSQDFFQDGTRVGEYKRWNEEGELYRHVLLDRNNLPLEYFFTIQKKCRLLRIKRLFRKSIHLLETMLIPDLTKIF